MITVEQAHLGERYRTPRGQQVELVDELPPGTQPGRYFRLRADTGTEATVPAGYRLTPEAEFVAAQAQQAEVDALVGQPPQQIREHLPRLSIEQLEELATRDTRMWLAAAIAEEQERRADKRDPTCPLCLASVETVQSSSRGARVLGTHPAGSGAQGVCAAAAHTVEEAEQLAQARAEAAAPATQDRHPFEVAGAVKSGERVELVRGWDRATLDRWEEATRAFHGGMQTDVLRELDRHRARLAKIGEAARDRTRIGRDELLRLRALKSQTRGGIAEIDAALREVPPEALEAVGSALVGRLIPDDLGAYLDAAGCPLPLRPLVATLVETVRSCRATLGEPTFWGATPEIEEARAAAVRLAHGYAAGREQTIADLLSRALRARTGEPPPTLLPDASVARLGAEATEQEAAPAPVPPESPSAPTVAPPAAGGTLRRATGRGSRPSTPEEWAEHVAASARAREVEASGAERSERIPLAELRLVALPDGSADVWRVPPKGPPVRLGAGTEPALAPVVEILRKRVQERGHLVTLDAVPVLGALDAVLERMKAMGVSCTLTITVQP